MIIGLSPYSTLVISTHDVLYKGGGRSIPFFADLLKRYHRTSDKLAPLKLRQNP